MSFAERLSAVEHAQEKAAIVSEAADLAEASGMEVRAPDHSFRDEPLQEPPHHSEVDTDGYDSEVWNPNMASDLDEDALSEVCKAARVGATSFEAAAKLSGAVTGHIDRSNGAMYQGQVLKGLACGRGRQKWTSGAIYEGDWVDDTMHGQGVLSTPDGARYDGKWRESRQHGEGKYVAPDRGFYEGQWIQGKMHGKGKYTWPDGSSFEGQFKNGEKEGDGTLRYTNGSLYVGGWADSKQHGLGVFTTKDGRSRRGEWENGTRTRWLDDVVPENPKSVAPMTPRSNFEIENSMGEMHRRPSRHGGLCTERCTKNCALM